MVSFQVEDVFLSSILFVCLGSAELCGFLVYLLGAHERTSDLPCEPLQKPGFEAPDGYPVFWFHEHASLKMSVNMIYHWNYIQYSRIYFKSIFKETSRYDGNTEAVDVSCRSSYCSHEGKPCSQLWPDSGLLIVSVLQPLSCHPDLAPISLWLSGSQVLIHGAVCASAWIPPSIPMA